MLISMDHIIQSKGRKEKIGKKILKQLCFFLFFVIIVIYKLFHWFHSITMDNNNGLTIETNEKKNQTTILKANRQNRKSKDKRI